MGCNNSAPSGAQPQKPTTPRAHKKNPIAESPAVDPATVPHTFGALYDLGEFLGEGGYSTVFEAISKVNRRKFAVKVCRCEGMTTEDETSLRQEIDILKELRHPNVTRCYDFFEEEIDYTPEGRKSGRAAQKDKRIFYIILEILEGGELFDRIVKKQVYSEKEARDLVVIVLTAIKYLHDQNIVHRDLKPENLLLLSKDNDTEIKLADFGFAVRVHGNSITDQCGTPGYIAPEILLAKPYGKPCDMWSFGVILYVLLGGYPPFHDPNQKQLFRQIVAGKYAFHPEYWKNVSEEAMDLIAGLLNTKPKERLTVDQALEHPWCRAAAEKLAARNLDSNLKELRKYQNTRKFKAAVRAVVAMNRMSFFTKAMTEAAAEAAAEHAADETADASVEGYKGGAGEVPEEEEQ